MNSVLEGCYILILDEKCIDDYIVDIVVIDCCDEYVYVKVGSVLFFIFLMVC